MPPPGFIIGMVLAAVAVVLIILRTRSYRELKRSEVRRKRSQDHLDDKMDELDDAIQLLKDTLAEKDAASASEPASDGGKDGARCSHCGGKTTATRPRRPAFAAPLARAPMRRRRKTAGRRPTVR